MARPSRDAYYSKNVHCTQFLFERQALILMFQHNIARWVIFISLSPMSENFPYFSLC